MEGLTILNTIYSQGWSKLFLIFAVILVVGMVLTVVVGLLNKSKSRNILLLVLAFVMTGSFMSCISMFISDDALIDRPTKYECIVDPEAYQKVIERYNVVEKRGNIWVLELMEGGNQK